MLLCYSIIYSLSLDELGDVHGDLEVLLPSDVAGLQMLAPPKPKESKLRF